MKWKIERNGFVKETFFLPPDEVQLTMYDCLLTNRPKTATKIYTGEMNKAPIAWIECAEIDINSDIKDVVGADRISYNPRTAPNWQNTAGDNVDKQVYSKLITYGRSVFYEKDGKMFELGGELGSEFFFKDGGEVSAEETWIKKYKILVERREQYKNWYDEATNQKDRKERFQFYSEFRDKAAEAKAILKVKFGKTMKTGGIIEQYAKSRNGIAFAKGYMIEELNKFDIPNDRPVHFGIKAKGWGNSSPSKINEYAVMNDSDQHESDMFLTTIRGVYTFEQFEKWRKKHTEQYKVLNEGGEPSGKLVIQQLKLAENDKTMKTGGTVLTPDELSDFNEWKNDGNVEKNEDGTYSTQDAQWKNKIKNLNSLKDYFKREFRSYKNGGEIEKLVKDGNLIFSKTKKQHSDIYGIDSDNPLFIQHLCIDTNKREKGLGKKVIDHIEDYAIRNNHDLIFGHITAKSKYGKKDICDAEKVKSWMVDKGYNIAPNTNDFYKKLPKVGSTSKTIYTWNNDEGGTTRALIYPEKDGKSIVRITIKEFDPKTNRDVVTFAKDYPVMKADMKSLKSKIRKKRPLKRKF